MKPGGVSTSGLLTLRDAQIMTTDLHALVGWSPPRPVGTGLGSAARRHAAGWPTAAQESAGAWVTRTGVMRAVEDDAASLFAENPLHRYAERLATVGKR